MDRINSIREAEKNYHDYCYDQYSLFTEGSWLHKPVKTVLDYMDFLEGIEEVKILDLGSGIGRNSIPMAQKLDKGKVVCVDILDSAIQKLSLYSQRFGVEDRIYPIKEDIACFEIQKCAFHYIVAVSSIEHVDSEVCLDLVLNRMVKGTMRGGINCLVVNSNVQEIDIKSGKKLEPMMEVNLSTDHMLEKLRETYSKWDELTMQVKPLEYKIQRNENDILMKTNAVTFVVRKR